MTAIASGLVLLSACAAQPKPEDVSAAYRDGYQVGCDAASNLTGRQSPEGAEQEFRAGWFAGYDDCAAAAVNQQRRLEAVEQTRRVGEAASRRAPVPSGIR
ncbi:MAG: hypothetical protein AAFR79_15900 [Pseudomonadota bacterium]